MTTYTTPAGINPELWLPGAIGLYNQALGFYEEKYKAKIEAMFQPVPVDRPDLIMAWLIGQLQIKRFNSPEPLRSHGLPSKSWVIPTHEYGESLKPTVKELKDDLLGLWDMKITGPRGLADTAAMYPMRYQANLIANGHATTPLIAGDPLYAMWDSQALFAARNEVAGTGWGVGTNYISATGGATLTGVQTDLLSAIAQIATYRDILGNPLASLEGYWIEYGPGLVGIMEPAVDSRTMVQGGLMVNGSSNPAQIFQIAQPIFNPYLLGTGFLVGCNSGPLKPFLEVVREPFTTFQNPYHATPDDGGYLVFGISGRLAYMPTAWWNFCHVGTNTATALETI